jgi:hypothetical protein
MQSGERTFRVWVGAREGTAARIKLIQQACRVRWSGSSELSTILYCGSLLNPTFYSL